MLWKLAYCAVIKLGVRHPRNKQRKNERRKERRKERKKERKGKRYASTELFDNFCLFLLPFAPFLLSLE